MGKKAAKSKTKRNVMKDLPAPEPRTHDVKGGRQTPKMEFGDRMKAGLDTAAGVVAAGSAVTKP
jgi:hypothetical protein